MQSGQHQSRLLGRGMEFAESRRYLPGDESRNIDWRVTARSGKAHTKLFAAEKERQVLLCVDLRTPMFFATKGVFKSVQAALMSGVLAWNAVQGGNRLGGLIFNNDDHFEFRPALGKKGALPLLQCLAENADYLSKNKKPARIVSMDDAIANIKRVAVPGSLIYILSDFRHLSPYACDMIRLLSKHSELFLCHLYDSIEASLPKNGLFPVTDGQDEIQLNTYDKMNLEKYRQEFIDRKELVESLGKYPHIHYLECRTEDDCLKLLKEQLL